MRHEQAWIIDQGGQSTRVIVYQNSGEAIFSLARQLSTSRCSNQVTHQPLQLAEDIKELLSGAAGRYNPSKAVIGIAAQRASFLAIDKVSMQPISPIVSWQDTRAAKLVSALDPVSRQLIYEHTGLMPNAHLGASKMQWLLRYDDEVRKAARQKRLVFLSVASYIAMLMTKELPYFDHATASRTGLFNIRSLSWEPVLLELWDIAEDHLPPLRRTHQYWGRYQQQALVNWVGGDQALMTTLESSAHKVSVNLGTGAFISYANEKQKLPSSLLLTLVNTSRSQVHRAIEGTVNAAATAIQWAATHLGLSVDHFWLKLERFNLNHKSAFQSDQAIPIFWFGEVATGSPFWSGRIKTCWSSISQIEKMALAVVEYIAFSLRANIDPLIRVNPDIRLLVLSGGLASQPSLGQVVANVSGLKIVIRSEKELTSIAVAKLLLSLPADKNDGEWFEPVELDALEQRYQRWLSVMMQKA